jgi:hypothetical protein
MHLFEWLAKGQFGPAGAKSDRDSANTFYDREVTPRYRVLKILIDNPEVVKAAREMRMALNRVRHLVVDSKTLPSAASTEFIDAHRRYRAERDRFIELTHADLKLELDDGRVGS